MTEIAEEQNSGGFDLQRYLNIAQRRHLQFLIPAFLGWLLVWAVSWVLPVKYKSGTMILVEEPTMPKNYITPNVSDDLQQRLQSIKQQVLSRTRLLLIIDKYQLYSRGRRHLTPDEKVAMMGQDIDIELVQDASREQINGFQISYSAQQPQIAQQVANDLAALFINENGRVRLEESEDTTRFLQDQLEKARGLLSEQEAKVRTFQSAHEGALPSQQASNLTILAGLQTQLESEQDALNAAKQQRSFYQTEIEQFRTVRATAHTPDGAPTGLAAIDEQLDKLRSNLADLSSRYTDNYPDVLSLKEQIAKTEKMRDALAAQLKAKGSGAQQNSAGGDATDPEDLSASAPLLQLKGQLKANQLEIANREQAISALKVKINDYQARLNEEPAIEQQLLFITRVNHKSKHHYH